MSGKDDLETKETEEWGFAFTSGKEQWCHWKARCWYRNCCTAWYDFPFRINKNMFYMKGLVVPGCAILEQHLQAVMADGHCHIVCAVGSSFATKTVTWQVESGIWILPGYRSLK